MAESDGGVLLDVKLNPDDAAKEFDSLTKKAGRLTEKLNLGKERLKAATDEAARLGAQLDAAKVRLNKMEESGTATADQLKTQAETVSSLQARFDAADRNLQWLSQSIKNTSSELAYTKDRAAEVAQEMTAAQESTAEVDQEMTAVKDRAAEVAQELGKGHPALEQMGKSAEKLENRLKKLASRVLVFSVFTTALRSLRSWFSDVIKTDKDAVAAIAQLKGALLTLVQPLVNVVIPAFTTLVQVLAQVVGAVASVVSSIFGSTVEESAAAAENLNDEKKALDGVGSSAKKAGKSLASFDEINKLSGDSAGESDSSASTEIAPDFSFLDGADERLQEIAKWVLLIGAGFALWKIGSNLGGALGGLLSTLGSIAIAVGGFILLLDGLKDAWENGVDWINVIEMLGGLATVAFGLSKIFGDLGRNIALAVGGVLLFVTGLKDAWENGLDWENAALMIAGLAAAAFGLYGIFGSLGAGIALVVGGLALLVTGFHDAFENGWTLQNLLTSMAGLFAAGLGIAFLTGSWIPALIGGIAALVLAMTVATGHGEELLQGLQMAAQGFLDFFTGIFTGDMEKAVGGINTLIEGLSTVFHAILSGIQDTILSFLDWLDEKTGGRFSGIIDFVKLLVNGVFEAVGSVVDGIMQVLQGLLEFITGVFTGNWDLAWEGVKDIFKGFVNGIVGFLGSGVNLLIKAVNFVIGKLNGLSFDVPDWVPEIGGSSVGINIPQIPEFQVPQLAAGAVIPPNREFMAVLGDQSSGNNLEAPEGLLRQVVREESGGDYTSLLQQILEAIKDGKVLMVDDDVFARVVHEADSRENSRRGMALVTVG